MRPARSNEMWTSRRSWLPAVVAGFLSGLTAALSGWLLRHVEIAGAARLAVGLLPVPFFIAFIIAELRWIRSADEFHRRVVLESLAIAFPAALVLAVAVEGLQKAGVVTDWTVGDVWPWMALLWVPAVWVSYRRYR